MQWRGVGGEVKFVIMKKSPTRLARELRQRMTPSEELMWNELRNRKLDGYKFRRQHPIVYERILDKDHFFIADFYCAEKKFVLELDGKIHESQQEYDKIRDAIIREKGITILRMKNEDMEDLELALGKIRAALAAL